MNAGCRVGGDKRAIRLRKQTAVYTNTKIKQNKHPDNTKSMLLEDYCSSVLYNKYPWECTTYCGYSTVLNNLSKQTLRQQTQCPWRISVHVLYHNLYQLWHLLYLIYNTTVFYSLSDLSGGERKCWLFLVASRLYK